PRPRRRPLVAEVPHALAAGRTRLRCARRPHPHVRRPDPLIGVRQPRDLRSDGRPVERRPGLARRPARPGCRRRGRQDLRDRGRPPGGVRPDGRGRRLYTLNDEGVGSGEWYLTVRSEYPLRTVEYHSPLPTPFGVSRTTPHSPRRL